MLQIASSLTLIYLGRNTSCCNLHLPSRPIHSHSPSPSSLLQIMNGFWLWKWILHGQHCQTLLESIKYHIIWKLNCLKTIMLYKKVCKLSVVVDSIPVSSSYELKYVEDIWWNNYCVEWKMSTHPTQITFWKTSLTSFKSEMDGWTTSLSIKSLLPAKSAAATWNSRCCEFMT